MMQNPIRHWLLVRIRILCVLGFLIGGLLPPFELHETLAASEDTGDSATPQYLLVEDGFLMKSSSLTQQGARRAYSEGIIHVVRDNENLQKIAQRYGIKMQPILWANNLVEDSTIRPGQELVILPVDGVLHTVTRGQTLQQIAELYNVNAKDVAAQNKVQGNFILAGQELIIPGGVPILAKGTVVAGTSPSLSFNPSIKGGFNGRQNPPAQSASKPTVAAQVEPSYGVLQMPCNNCFYTQFYHPGHYAVDIQTRGGGPIFAAEDGIVSRADYGWDGGYGNVIEIDHGNGLVTLYGHNKELYVKLGEHVKRGQEISFMGNTGRVYGSTGIHVHFEVRVNGEKKNPLLYLK